MPAGGVIVVVAAEDAPQCARAPARWGCRRASGTTERRRWRGSTERAPRVRRGATVCATPRAVSATELVALVCCDLGAIVRGRSLLAAELGEHLRAGVGWVPANHALTPLGPLAEPNPFGSTGDLRLLPDPDTHVRVEGSPPKPGAARPDRSGASAGARAVRHRRDRRDAVGVLPAALPARGARASWSGSSARAWWRASSTSSSCCSDAPPGAAVLAGGAAARRTVRGRGDGRARRSRARSPSASSPSTRRTSSRSPSQPPRASRPPTAAWCSGRSCARSPAGGGCARASRRCSTPTRRATACTSTSACSTRDGAPLLYDAARPACLSELGGRFAAGILRHARALSALSAPSPVSAARLAPHRWSAGAVCLGERNREALLRIPPLVALAGADPARQLRLEYRGADAAANPYLALGAIVRAGLDGRARGAAAAADPRPRPRAARRRRGRALRRRRAAGVARGVAAGARRGRRVRGWLAPPLYDAYVGVKRAELDAVADLDLERGVPALCRDLLTRAARAAARGHRARAAARGRRCATACTHSPELAHAEERTAAAVAAGAARCASRDRSSPGRAGSPRVRPRSRRRRAGGGARRARRAADRERTGAPFAPAARRCTPAGTTCTWRRWSRWRAPRTRSATSCPRRCWRSSSRARRPTPRAPSSSRAASSRRSRPAAVVAAHVHPELPWGTVALDAGRGQRLVRRGRDHGRRASPRTAPTRTTGATRSSRSRRSSSRCTPRSAGASTRCSPAVLTVGVLEGGSAENVIPARARARAALRAHRPEDRAGAARSWSRRSWPASPRPTAAARTRRARCRASRRSRTTPGSSRARASCCARRRPRARPAVALVRLGRLRLLRRARADRDGVRRPRRRRGLHAAPAAPPRAAAPRRRGRRGRARAGGAVRGRSVGGGLVLDFGGRPRGWLEEHRGGGGASMPRNERQTNTRRRKLRSPRPRKNAQNPISTG